VHPISIVMERGRKGTSTLPYPWHGGGISGKKEKEEFRQRFWLFIGKNERRRMERRAHSALLTPSAVLYSGGKKDNEIK